MFDNLPSVELLWMHCMSSELFLKAVLTFFGVELSHGHAEVVR